MAAPAFEEHDLGLSWLADSGEKMQRACHAVRLGGTVWVVDPVDVPGLDERIAAVGEPAGVLQLLDRHERDCAMLAERLGVPLHRIPYDGVEDASFEPVTVIHNRLWNEVAIWSAADRALIVPEAVGTAPYFRSGDEAIGVHPFLRLIPPRKLTAYEPVHLLTGHGTGMHGPDTPEALRDALDGSRRRLPGAMVSMIRPRRG